MPLIQGKSKKAFGENVATEMRAGKPQDQSLAISYSIQRKNKKKKMAFGGKAEATTEPAVPAKKPDDMRPPMSQYMADHFAKGGTVKYYMNGDEVSDEEASHPERKLDVEEMSDEDFINDPNTLPNSKNERREPGSDDTDPDEDPANLAFGGKAEDDMEPPVPGSKADDKRFPEDEYMSTDKWSKGSAPARKPDDMRPPKDEYMADHFAEGGEAEGHYESIADAIRAKKGRKMMADGGMVDLNENAEEEPNNEDDLSFEALKKENYSEDDGLEQMGSPEDSSQKGRKVPGEDSHDMVDAFEKDVDYDERGADDTDMLNAIMRKMRAKRS